MGCYSVGYSHGLLAGEGGVTSPLTGWTAPSFTGRSVEAGSRQCVVSLVLSSTVGRLRCLHMCVLFTASLIDLDQSDR